MCIYDGVEDQQLLMQLLLKVQKQMALPLQPAYLVTQLITTVQMLYSITSIPWNA